MSLGALRHATSLRPLGTFTSLTHHLPRARLRSPFHSCLCQRRQLAISAPHLGRQAQRGTPSAWAARAAIAAVILGGGWVAFENYQPFRFSVLAAVRCSRVAVAAVKSAVDYKWTFSRTYASDDERQQAASQCHTRSAHRVLQALLANGGIFIKLGQHISSLMVLPVEWTSTMRPLQDKCEPTPIEEVDSLFLSDMGASTSDLFSSFEPVPIGVASLAQVHLAVDRKTGQEVAVKLQHPHLAEFSEVDMRVVEVTMDWINFFFPEFEFTWLAGEMRENLPKEMNFVNEADNARRADANFAHVRTSLYIPKVLVAKPRVLIMELIRGGRVDDLRYLAEHKIDRNTVALELSRIFSKMVHIDGFFHGDPHAGNLFIRPSQPHSKSPYNFEIVLLDHGLYFDIDDSLRINYSKFWLSLIAPSSPEVNAERRKYAQLFGNINSDLYPVFEAALTGRATLEGATDDPVGEGQPWGQAKSVLKLDRQSEAERDAIRNAVIEREGLLVSVFDVLRRVPRRILMIFKLNDLTRSLDHALMTTHSNIRVFMVTARYCARAVWQDDRLRLLHQAREQGFLSFSLLWEYVLCWWRFEKTYRSLGAAETYMDTSAALIKFRDWTRGLRTRGFRGAREAAAGLA